MGGVLPLDSAPLQVPVLRGQVLDGVAEEAHIHLTGGHSLDEPHGPGVELQPPGEPGGHPGGDLLGRFGPLEQALEVFQPSGHGIHFGLYPGHLSGSLVPGGADGGLGLVQLGLQPGDLF